MPNPSENWLLRAKADLTPAIMAKAIAKRLKKLGVPWATTSSRAWTRGWHRHRRPRARAHRAEDRHRRPRPGSAAAARTTPARVPEGSRATAGIGCHYMAVWMDRSTSTFTQMGGEGVPGSARRRSPKTSMCSPTWATAPTSTAAAGHPPEHRRRREHHLQDAFSTTRSR